MKKRGKITLIVLYTPVGGVAFFTPKTEREARKRGLQYQEVHIVKKMRLISLQDARLTFTCLGDKTERTFTFNGVWEIAWEGKT